MFNSVCVCSVSPEHHGKWPSVALSTAANSLQPQRRQEKQPLCKISLLLPKSCPYMQCKVAHSTSSDSNRKVHSFFQKASQKTTSVCMKCNPTHRGFCQTAPNSSTPFYRMMFEGCSLRVRSEKNERDFQVRGYRHGIDRVSVCLQAKGHLSLWPGVECSISQHKHNKTMNSTISRKVYLWRVLSNLLSHSQRSIILQKLSHDLFVELTGRLFIFNTLFLQPF